LKRFIPSRKRASMGIRDIQNNNFSSHPQG
jgi:hypothetical protein